MTEADVIRRFTFHPAEVTERRQAHEDIRSGCLQLGLLLHNELPGGAEKQSAMFRLEEVMFWATAAVARQPRE
ncbi:Acb2/Tad1 domain-containing protein [Streptomyces sp. NPDC002172]